MAKISITTVGTISHSIDKNLYLVRQPVTKVKPVAVRPPVHHVAVIDCSGSMSSELPKIREQLKKRLPKLLHKDDTISIVWFSGRGQFGTLIEAEPVATLADLQEVNHAIDRWLKPVGLTGFKEPMEEVDRLIGKIGKQGPKDAVFALFFMSDGCDNQWSRPDIVRAVEKTGKQLASATFVEYGYYADRNLLSTMAEKAGGSLIFADTFDKYAPEFERTLTKPLAGGKRIEVAVAGDPILGLCWVLDDNRDLVTFDTSTGKALVPEGTRSLAYLAPAPVGTVGDPLATVSKTRSDGDTIGDAYAAMSVLAVRMKPDIVYPILRAIGDVSFINAFSVCFGKQRYSDFMQAAQAAAFDDSKRYTSGWDPTRVPPDDAFTVFDLLQTLSQDDKCRLLLDHPAFAYNRISRARVDADENLSTEEQAQVDELTAKMRKTKAVAKIKEYQAEIDAIMASKRTSLKFEPRPAADGYAVSSLTYNEERPNISVLVRKEGTVNLAGRLPAEFKGSIPETFPTFIYRNYAIVKDGLVNVDKLPVVMSPAARKTLRNAGVEVTLEGGAEVINVGKLPIMNRKMIKAASAKDLFTLEWELTKLRAEQKVYNTIKKDKWPKESKGFKASYGEAAANWLKEQGITDYSGFSPKQVVAESTDFYVGKQLAVSLKGYSTLPSVKDVREKMAKGKVTGNAALMAETIEEVDRFFAKNPDKFHEKWLDGKLDATTAATRGCIFNKAQRVFSIVVGQIWFDEFASLEENTMTLKLDGNDLVGVVEMKDVEIKI
jgi:hypothetical protein